MKYLNVSRYELYEIMKEPTQNLPKEHFGLYEWQAKVNIDYHVQFECNYYSVFLSLCT